MIKTAKKKTGNIWRFKNFKENAKNAEIPVLLLDAVSLFSSFGDMPLAVLSLIFVQMGKRRGTKYTCGTLSAVYFLSTVTYTAFYIPYTAFILIYLIADWLLEHNTVKSVWPAAVTFIVTKGYVLSFGYEVSYWAVFAVEIAAVIFIPEAIFTGFDILKYNEDCQSGENIFEVICALAVTAFALDGIAVWGIQFSTVFLLTAACFYGVKNNYVLSFTAVFVMMISLCHNKNFGLLFAGFTALYCSGLLWLGKGIKGYGAYIASAMAVSAICITRFNSIVFVSSAGMSAVMYFIAGKLLNNERQKTKNINENVGWDDYAQLKYKLEKLNRCFRFLGHTVIDISNLMSREFGGSAIEETVAEEICRKCKNNMYCWQEKYSHTQGQFSQYANALQKGKKPHFDNWFYSQCDKSETVAESFEKHHRLSATQKLIQSQGQHNQRILQKQFLSMASILQEISYQSSLSGAANAAYTHKANSFLSLLEKKVNYCICYQNPDRCIVSTKEPFENDVIYKLKSKLEGIYCSRFDTPVKDTDGENTVYIFNHIPFFTVETGTKSQSCHNYCGDICEFFTTEEYAYTILADGMGTGSFAQAESKTAVAMLRSLISASVKTETAIELTNVALNLKGTGQSCVAIDVLQINLYNGKCCLYKAGAAPSFIISENRTETIYKDSLPIGILKDIRIAQFSFILNNGDIFILTSDGVEMDGKKLMAAKLAAEKATPHQLAEFLVKSEGNTDDATAAVITLIRK